MCLQITLGENHGSGHFYLAKTRTFLLCVDTHLGDETYDDSLRLIYYHHHAKAVEYAERRIPMRGCGLTSGRRIAGSVILCLAVVSVLGLSNLASSLAAGQQANGPAKEPDPAIERGHKQFEQTCGFCHGADATGARGPDLVRSPLVAHDVKGDLIGKVIREGRADKGMPPLSLADPQVLDIATYLHARAAEASASSRVPTGYPVEKLLTGNAEAGKAYFNGAGGCINCHSPTGDLAGLAGKNSPVDLQAHMLYPRGKHITAVVTLSSGEEIKGPLAHADEFEIALRDGSGSYRSFPRDRVKVELTDAQAAHRELLDKITQADIHNLFAYLESLK
jgi:cytochrome c oxidase cbb3-type subunit 3